MFNSLTSSKYSYANPTFPDNMTGWNIAKPRIKLERISLTLANLLNISAIVTLI